MKTADRINPTEDDVIPFEHERRFFPDVKKLEFDPSLHQEIFIMQGYLEDKLNTRLRDQSNDEEGVQHTYWQTRKSGKGVSRKEDEQQISKEIFDSMWVDVTCSLTKSRYCVPWGDIIVEFNIFHDELRGYIQIEVEFKTHEEAVAFVPPEWFGLEVTDDSRHGNYALAKNGCKDLL